MVLSVVLLIAGLISLTVGAEILVCGSGSLARRLGLTPLVIGLTVVAFGTSTPEMVVSISSTLGGYGDIAISNVVGSNIFNIGMILALTALISPIDIKLATLKLDAPLVIGASILAAWFIRFGIVSRDKGILLLSLLIIYTMMSLHLARRQASQEVKREFDQAIPGSARSLPFDVVFILGGLGFLVLGSRLLVESTMEIAQALGVSETIIGLTIVGAGTSMPELATSCIAAFRGQSDIAVGNVLGSNLFNALGILGLTAIVKPPHAPGIRPLDLWVMLAFSLALLPLLWTGRRLQRWEGGLLIVGYLLYVWRLWPE